MMRRVLRSKASSLVKIVTTLGLTLFLFLLALCLFFDTNAEGIAPAGGSDAQIRDFPYQVSLQVRGRHICAGSIISATNIVTAAHCITNGRVRASQLYVRAGSGQVSHGSLFTYTRVAKAIPHPNFDPITYDNDIAVLELSDPLQFNPATSPIELPPANTGLPSEETPCNITGWGWTQPVRKRSNMLQVLNTKVDNRETCVKKYDALGKRLSERMFCSGSFEDSRDTCYADSGGPLVSDGVLIGVASWGDVCAQPRYPAIHSSVSVLRDFIAQTAGV